MSSSESVLRNRSSYLIISAIGDYNLSCLRTVKSLCCTNDKVRDKTGTWLQWMKHQVGRVSFLKSRGCEMTDSSHRDYSTATIGQKVSLPLSLTYIIIYSFIYLMIQGFMYPTLASNLLCCRGCSWTLGPPTSKSLVLGPQVYIKISNIWTLRIEYPGPSTSETNILLSTQPTDLQLLADSVPNYTSQSNKLPLTFSYKLWSQFSLRILIYRATRLAYWFCTQSRDLLGPIRY